MSGDDHDSGWEEATRTVMLPDVGAGERADKAYLIVLAGSRVGEMVRVGESLSIGRSMQADFRVTDDGVSRIHVELHANPDGTVRADDSGSRNGTYVNGERITTLVLRDGDKIQIGSTTILKCSYADNLEESFQQRMYEAALRDPLTRLYNRRHLLEQLESEFSYVMRHRTPLSLVLMDIDHFKGINDRFGHLVGDAVLVRFSEVIRNAIRVEDLAARYGGEEFVLVCRGVQVAGGLNIANRIRQVVERTQFMPERPELNVTISAGVAGGPEHTIGTSQALLDAADQALYQAKRSGRNRCCVFGP